MAKTKVAFIPVPIEAHKNFAGLFALTGNFALANNSDRTPPGLKAGKYRLSMEVPYALGDPAKRGIDRKYGGKLMKAATDFRIR